MPVKLHYEAFGMGVPIVCIHGFPLDHTIWQPMIPALAASNKIILPDLRGHGFSPVPAGPYSMPEMAGDIIALLDDLNLPQVMLVGQSMGGYVALEMAHQAPERLLGLALVASHPYADSAQQKQARMDMIARVQKEGVEKTFVDFPLKLCPEASVQEFTWTIIRATEAKGIVGSIHAMAGRQDRKEVLVSAPFPTAVVLGEKDPFIPAEVQLRLQADCRDASITILPDAAHMLMMEKPLEVAAILQKMR
jgi:pimeloyl-ACP methyl ester carboxylesterase